jgi:chaperonin GroES
MAKKKEKKPDIVILGDRFLVKAAEKEPEKKTASGIILAESSESKNEPPHRGLVIVAGEGRMLDDGTLVPMRIKVGDTILFPTHYGYDEVTIDDVEYLIISESAVLGIVPTV